MKQLGIVLLSRYANDSNNDINNKPMITTTDKNFRPPAKFDQTLGSHGTVECFRCVHTELLKTAGSV